MSTSTVVKPSIKFKFNEYISFPDLKYILHNFLPYSDNKKLVKFEYRSPSIDNKGKIEFINFEQKTGAYLKAMWNTFFCYKMKVPIEVDTMISRSIDSIS